jgi:NTE family protein
MLWDAITRFHSGAGEGQPASPSPPKQETAPRIGLALGGGAARGWAHMGVLQALSEANIRPDVIAGTSIGAVVGGCYAASRLDDLRAWARSLTKRRLVTFMDFHIGGSGLIAGERLRRMLVRELQDMKIEELPLKYTAVATELGTGHEIWLTHGSLVEAMRASYALPGVFDPVKLSGRWLMDGAMVNPVPVTAARAMGADVVICVNLNGDAGGRGTTIQSHSAIVDTVLDEGAAQSQDNSWLGAISGAARRVRGMVQRQDEGRAADLRPAPGITGVMIDAFNITQDRISRSRLAGDPPDVMISPRLGKIGLFDFHRADETIEAGYVAARRMLDDIRESVAASAQSVG